MKSKFVCWTIKVHKLTDDEKNTLCGRVVPSPSAKVGPIGYYDEYKNNSGFLCKRCKAVEEGSATMTALWTYTSDSCGYALFRDGVPQGGARALGTATHTSDGRVRHWKHRKADIKQHAETARLLCDRKNAMESDVTT